MSIIKKRHTRTPAYRIAATLIATATTRGNIFAGFSQLTNLPIPHSKFLLKIARDSNP
jgi:hypothetical protein